MYKVKNKDDFMLVFGADSFLEYWPQLLTTGVELKELSGCYYIVINGVIAHDTAFFTEDEMQYLELVTN